MQSRPRILYIEDDQTLQRALRRALDDDFDLTFAEDASTGLALLRSAVALEETRFDHIVCDYRLANGSTGREVIEWIWQQEAPLRHRLLDRFTFVADSTQAKELHDRYVRKPIGERALRNVLATQGPLCLDNPSLD